MTRGGISYLSHSLPAGRERQVGSNNPSQVGLGEAISEGCPVRGYQTVRPLTEIYNVTDKPRAHSSDVCKFADVTTHYKEHRLQ